MHGMHPASISTRAAETQEGARAAVVVHGVFVDRRSVGCREGRLCPAFALPSIHPGGSTYLNSRPSSSPRWMVGGLSSMAPRTRKSGKAVLAGRVGWRPELLGHGDGRWRRRPQAVKGRGEDEMKRGGRGRRRAHGEAQGLEKRHREQIWSSAARRPRPPPPWCGHPGSYTVATFKREVCTHFLFYKKRCTRSSTLPLKNCRVSWLLNKFIHEIDAAV